MFAITLDPKGSAQLSGEISITKEKIAQIAHQISEPTLNGEEDPVEMYIKIRALQEILKQAEKNIKEVALVEAEKYEKNASKFNISFEYMNGRRNWDYSSDTRYNELRRDLKDRENFLKTLKEPVADPETGELIQPIIPKCSKDTIKIQFNNQ